MLKKLGKLIKRPFCSCRELNHEETLIKGAVLILVCANCGRRWVMEKNLISGEFEVHKETACEREAAEEFKELRDKFLQVDFVEEGVVHDEDRQLHN